MKKIYLSRNIFVGEIYSVGRRTECERVLNDKRYLLKKSYWEKIAIEEPPTYILVFL